MRRRVLVAVLGSSLVLGTAACADRLTREDVDGVDCVVINDGFGRPRRLDCDWQSEP